MSSKVIQVALNEVGYIEKKTNAQLDNKTANAGHNNYTKYWRDLAPGMQAQYWCNAFVNWCFVEAYGERKAKELLCTPGGWSYYTPTSAGYFRNKGQYFKKDPKKGDVIYFRDSIRICHIGIVIDVDKSYVYTIEGNTSGGNEIVPNGGGVFQKKYRLDNTRIDGYGRPNYSIVNSAPVIFNADFYKGIHKDLQKLNSNELVDHYLTYGIKEGRAPSPIFDPKWYLDTHSDLKKAFGNDYSAAYDHFMSYGIKEGRASSFTFDFATYIGSNPDLQKAFGKDYQAVLDHFMKYGCKEFRKTSKTFDVSTYRTSNKDLNDAYKDACINYYIHWYAYGKAEKRKCI